MKKTTFNCYRVLLVALLLPLAARGETGATRIRRLYPHLNNQVLHQKVQGSHHVLKFYRTFVALHYDFLSKEGATLKLMKDLKPFGGWCVGDAHLENFGSIIMRDGRAIFSVNDMDDAGPCPLAADFLRLLVAADLTGIDRSDLEKMIDEYSDSFKASGPKLSRPVKDLIEEAESDERRIKKNDLDGNDKLKRDKALSPIKDLNGDEVDAIRKILHGVKPGTRLIDGFNFTPATGGSAGSLRYRLLVDITLERTSERMVLELKQITPPGIAPLASSPIPNDSQRIMNTVKLLQGTRAAPVYRVVSLKNKSFLMRPLWKGNQGIELKEYKSMEQVDIVRDEAQTLGLIHKKAAYDPAGYARAVNATTKQVWMDAARATGKMIREIYGSVKR